MWTFDADAGQYYLHRFYHHQPDLNVANAAVRDEIAKVIGFWLAQGLAGFRVDAVPFLLEVDGIDEKMEVAPTSTYAICGRSSSGGAGMRSCSARSTCRSRNSEGSSATRTATS